MRTAQILAGLAGAFLLAIPSTALAFPFGGQASVVIPCYNGAIYALLGPPIGGPFVYVLGMTEAFQFGAPTHSGQWVLGNAGPPFDCLVSVLPIITYPATTILMMGSSQ